MMKETVRNGWHGPLPAGIFFLLLILLSVPLSGADEILIIGSKDLPADSVSRDEIKNIFLGEKVKWDSGEKISFVLLTEVHEAFLKQYLGSTAAQYQNYWKKMIFTGKAKSPKSFNSPEKVIEYVANTAGSIAYIPSEGYGETDRDKVKIISVR
ncbi:MAG: hypothetical protein AB7S75_22290 [Desulfococcaceae bacterium]